MKTPYDVQYSEIPVLTEAHVVFCVFYLETLAIKRGRASGHEFTDWRRLALFLTYRFGLDGKGYRTYRETGKLLGVSPERTRQALHQAICIAIRSPDGRRFYKNNLANNLSAA